MNPYAIIRTQILVFLINIKPRLNVMLFTDKLRIRHNLKQMDTYIVESKIWVS